uniref:myb-related transcription factor, partner of profilin-like n=1 Tax=Pristiophorus japonicus TaxID=55135 RepID=UPI00398EC4E4
MCKIQGQQRAAVVNASSLAPSTWTQCRKKFNDLTRVVKEKVAYNRCQQHLTSEGQARLHNLTLLEKTVLAIIGRGIAEPMASSGAERIQDADLLFPIAEQGS